MALNAQNFMELITSILSGGFAGAAVVALLFKFLIKNQLKKSLKQYQHDLDTKKDSLQAELAIYTEQAKLRFINHGQKTITALELVYGSFIRTSLPRQGFKKSWNIAAFESTEDKLNSAYFEVFSENFQAMDRAFKAVSSAYQCVEENSIYMEQVLETDVTEALRRVISCYQKWHAELILAHDSAQMLFKKGALNSSTRTMDFGTFYSELLTDWQMITGPVRTTLKLKVRDLLSP